MKSSNRNSAEGFTLVELLVAMSMAGIIMAAIFSAYLVQVRGKNTQEMALEMQQGGRMALEVIAREIRQAGCNPSGDADARILVANKAELIFSMDVADDNCQDREDGDVCDCAEVIRYALTNDADENGIADATPCHLGRQTGAGLDASLLTVCADVTTPANISDENAVLVRNVDALDFVYLLEDGTRIPAPVAATDLDDIAGVQVTLIVRSGETLRALVGRNTDTTTYLNDFGDTILPAPNDEFRRLQLSTIVSGRNLRD